LAALIWPTLNIVGKENRFGIDLLEKPLEDFYFAPSAVAIYGAEVAPAQTNFSSLFVDTHLGFRDIKEVVFILQ
jgi:hypothetical protein